MVARRSSFVVMRSPSPGASLDEVSTVFASAQPDRVAPQYWHLLPRARLAAVLAAKTD